MGVGRVSVEGDRRASKLILELRSLESELRGSHAKLPDPRKVERDIERDVIVGNRLAVAAVDRRIRSGPGSDQSGGGDGGIGTRGTESRSAIDCRLDRVSPGQAASLGSDRRDGDDTCYDHGIANAHEPRAMSVN